MISKVTVGFSFFVILLLPTFVMFVEGQTEEEPKPEDIDVQITLDTPAKCSHVIVKGGEQNYNAMLCTMTSMSDIGIGAPCLFHPEISKNASWSLVSPSLCEGIGDY